MIRRPPTLQVEGAVNEAQAPPRDRSPKFHPPTLWWQNQSCNIWLFWNSKNHTWCSPLPKVGILRCLKHSNSTTTAVWPLFPELWPQHWLLLGEDLPQSGHHLGGPMALRLALNRSQNVFRCQKHCVFTQNKLLTPGGGIKVLSRPLKPVQMSKHSVFTQNKLSTLAQRWFLCSWFVSASLQKCVFKWFSLFWLHNVNR